LRRRWPELDQNARDIIIREIKEARDQHRDDYKALGDKCDYDDWLHFLAWAENYVEVQNNDKRGTVLPVRKSGASVGAVEQRENVVAKAVRKNRQARRVRRSAL
jgi:hypothetical protein